MIIVHNPNYKNIILSSFQTEGKPPPMIVEFYKQNVLIYLTTVVKGIYNQDLNTVQLYAINPNPIDDCTRVVWKDMNDTPIYEVEYSPFLTKYSMQVCHIVISYDPNEPISSAYLEIPADVLNQLLEEDGPKIVNYYINNRNAVPENRLYAKILYNQATNKLNGIIHVKINNQEAKIKRIDGVYTLEF